MEARSGGSDGRRNQGMISDKELACVLTRASELDAVGGRGEARTSGRSLAEAESIAREAGISPESFRKALAELELGRSPSPWVRRVFGNMRPGITLSVKGSLEEERLEEILDSLAGIARLRGAGSVRRRGLRWSSDSYENQRTGKALDIMVAHAAEGVDISVKYDLRNAAGGIFGGICGGLGLGWGFGLGMGVGLGVLHSPVFAILFPLASIALSYFLARGWFSLVSKRSGAEAERIAGLIAGSLEEGGAPAAPPMPKP